MSAGSAPKSAEGDAPSEQHGASLSLDTVSGGRTLVRIADWLAMLGGVLLIATIAITIVSVIGRYAFGAPVPGDYELVEIVCAIAIFLFFPMTHASDGNLRAEFFTTALPEKAKLALDIVHDIVFMLIAALLAWRMSHALLDKLESGEGSLFLRIPLWWPLTIAVGSMALLSVVCLLRIIAAAGAIRR
jgi:TRAP-type C4-dicarboxylate transport system permease small subunit